jgi:hypothetical protein
MNMRLRDRFFGVAIFFLLASLIALICLVVDTANAAEFKWTYTAEQQKHIDGFRIYDGNHKVVLDKIKPDKRKATVTEPTACTGYYCVAYKGKDESDESTIVAYCPPTVVIPPAGGFVAVKPSK